MSSRARCPIVSLYHLKSIRWKTFIVILHHKADPLLLRYNILKYKLSLSISLMLLVSKTLVFVKSTLRSQITTHELLTTNYSSFSTMKPSYLSYPTSSYWGANVFTKKAALGLPPFHAFTGCDMVNTSRRPKRKRLEHLDQLSKSHCCVHGLSGHLQKYPEWFVSTPERIHLLLHDRKSSSLLSTKPKVQ